MKAIELIKGLVALCLCLAFAAHAAGEPRTKVVFGMGSPMAPYTSYIVFGQQSGIFAEEGIDIEFVSLQGSGVLIPQIVNKSVTIGLASPDLAVLALEKGAPYPAKFFYNVYTRHFFELVVPAGSAVRTVGDLKGKKIGIGALNWGSTSMIKAILAEQGIEWGKDIQVLPVGIGPAAWQRLSKGEVDAMWMFMHQNELMNLTALPIRRIPLADKYYRVFANGLMAHADTLRDNPKLLEGFARAYSKAHRACEKAMETCVKAYWAYDPASRPPPEKEAAWVQTFVSVAKMDLVFARANEKPGHTGEYDVNAWRLMGTFMKDGGQIGRADLDYEQLFTNQLVQGINKAAR